MESLQYTPIGVIHSPFIELEGMPIQPAGARGVKGRVHLAHEYAPGLKDLEGFSHIILIYHFHRSVGYELHVVPFLDTVSHGVLATRAPRRPNAIGLSVVRLLGIDGPTLTIEDVDILDGTPLLDIKPYIPDFDHRPGALIGWLEGGVRAAGSLRSDTRFDPSR